MNMRTWQLGWAVVLAAMAGGRAEGRDSGPEVAPLPPGVRAVWNLESAERERTPTRERVCLNGLWRWQPTGDGSADAEEVPAQGWGHFKVPGAWPGITDYMQKDAQSVFAHASWQARRLRDVTAAWYQREFTLPSDWSGRRIVLAAEYVNSVAGVWLDGRRIGEIRFPGGELDLTAACRPGATHVLSLRVAALPLKEVLLSYADTNTAREVRARVARRGLCGDVHLLATPAGARIEDVKVETSWRRREVTFEVALAAMPPDGKQLVEVVVSRDGRAERTFRSAAFRGADLAEGRLRFSASWRPEALWDLHTPRHQFEYRARLVSEGSTLVDEGFAGRFGFREFWIEGRDFFLNGSRLQLSVVPLDNAQVSAALASYSGARESLERLRDLGINFVYTHNYGCEPGSHLGFAEILRAADDVGMLVGFSQPHFSHYDWKGADADQNNGYARHAAFYVRAAQNHPAVVAYAMNHNATGYAGDMNPELIDGIRDPREARAQANARQARRVEALVQRLDATRVIYHHSSGNLGSMHTINFYPNFVPPQELSDWFEHWATEGVKPLFLCEYGAPFSWDWTMYRGWYKGERAFGSAAVPWEFCLAEWNAQFLGDSAYLISAREAANLRWEARQLAAGKVWHRWDYPHEVGSRDFDERYPVFARYLRENWPAFRTWGVSAISPWEFGHYWKPRPGVDRSRRELPVDWTRLQRAGFSPDYIEGRYERMDLAFERSDWIATPAAEALLRYNRPLLACVAGRPGAFTSKDHVFRAGESFEKQIILINNSRVAVEADVEWSVPGLPGAAGHRKLEVSPGRKESVPIRVTLAIGQAPGDWVLKARVRFSTGETQEDEFRLQVLPASRDGHPSVGAVRLALLDPRGETAELLSRLGVPFRKMEATGSLEPGEILVVGKGAMEVAGILPDLGAVREGLKVIVFEQTAEVLEQRLGFRVAEYGLREVFPRVPDHPVLAGLNAAQLQEWRGEGTLVPPRLIHQMHPRLGPTVQRAGLTVPRLWRCGNRGTVASVSIEKPPRGDFLALIDGGFALQYSPLLEFREGRGRIWFCQLDVTGRTEPDPVADQLVRNLLSHVGAVDSGERRTAVYAGERAGRDFLVAAGFSLAEGSLPPRPADAVWVLGPGAAQIPGIDRQVLADFVSQGGRVVSLGLPAGDLRALWPSLRTEPAEHLAPKFKAGDGGPWLAGLGPGEFHHRAPQVVPLFREGAAIVGNGVLAAAHEGRVVFCQVEPWSLGGKAQANLRRTFRRLAVGVSRLLANQGMEGRTPLLARFAAPVTTGERRWSEGLYLDMPEEWDDPYRFFRW